MRPELENLEDRTAPSALGQITPIPEVDPTVTVLGVGVDANAFVPMVQMMLGDNSTLLNNAGYSVGHGTLAAVVNLPSNGGTYTEAQIDAQIEQKIDAGAIPIGPNAMVLVQLDKPPTDAPSNAAAYHDGFSYKGFEIVTTWTWMQAWMSIPDTHEFDEAVARMAGVNFEICDPIENFGVWNAEPLDGFNVSDFVLPDGVTPDFPLGQLYIGDPYQIGPYFPPVPTPTPPLVPTPTPPVGDLFTLAVERAEVDVLTFIAQYDPALDTLAQQSVLALQANPWYGSQVGQVVESHVDVLLGV